jgi:DNA-binding PadR family transcriptional regulator
VRWGLLSVPQLARCCHPRNKKIAFWDQPRDKAISQIKERGSEVYEQVREKAENTVEKVQQAGQNTMAGERDAIKDREESNPRQGSVT